MALSNLDETQHRSHRSHRSKLVEHVVNNLIVLFERFNHSNLTTVI